VNLSTAVADSPQVQPRGGHGVGGVKWTDDDETLGEIFCLTFIKKIDETEALSRLGALPDNRTLPAEAIDTAVEVAANARDGHTVRAATPDPEIAGTPRPLPPADLTSGGTPSARTAPDRRPRRTTWFAICHGPSQSPFHPLSIRRSGRPGGC